LDHRRGSLTHIFQSPPPRDFPRTANCGSPFHWIISHAARLFAFLYPQTFVLGYPRRGIFESLESFSYTCTTLLRDPFAFPSFGKIGPDFQARFPLPGPSCRREGSSFPIRRYEQSSLGSIVPFALKHLDEASFS